LTSYKGICIIYSDHPAKEIAMNEYAKQTVKKWATVILVAIGMMIAASVICSPLLRGGSDLSGPEWDRYFGCLEIQQDWGQTESEAWNICKPHRP
jgi:hypothetical protein